MMLVPVISIFNYALILFFGLLLSTHFAGGPKTQKERRLISVVYPFLFVVQGVFWLFFDVEITRMIYPLITHLPLVLVLVFAMKKSVKASLVCVFTAYLCCQLPRWAKLFILYFAHSELLAEIGYTLAVVAFYLLLRRYFVKIAADAIAYSTQNLYLFGSLPFVYYIFDYSTVIYSNALYMGIPVMTEFFPTALIIFYVVFLAAYHRQTQARSREKLQQSMLEMELKQSGEELESLRRIDSQTAIYQHNMRHHMTVISGYLAANREKDALEYIKTVQADIEAISPKRFCANELVNLLCSSFQSKAEQQGVALNVDAKLPQKLSISDTELCAVLSNGLENALHAVCNTDENVKWIELYCDIRNDKLLVEIRNPYAGEVVMHDALPVSSQEGHGFGCRSIHSITEQSGGLCSFEAQDGIFTMRVILPLVGAK